METNIKSPELKKPTPPIPGGAPADSPLENFFIEALQDIYWAEQELVKALPVMIDAAATEELAEALADHLEETNMHVTRLEEVFEIMGRPATAKHCFAMEGLLKEGNSVIEETAGGSAKRDAAIIMAAQKVEHYEIASYGSLSEYAKALGIHAAHGLLDLTLNEERMADHGLTIIAQNKINWEAETADEPDSNELPQ